MSEETNERIVKLIEAMSDTIKQRDDAIEIAGDLIANVYNGYCGLATEEWKLAAAKWRHEYLHIALNNFVEGCEKK